MQKKSIFNCLLIAFIPLFFNACYLESRVDYSSIEESRELRLPRENKDDDSIFEQRKKEIIEDSFAENVNQRVVLMLPFSGKFQQLSQFTVEGANFAIEELEKSDPQLSSNFSIIQEDTVASPQVGAEVYSRIAEADPKALIVGPLTSGVAAAMKSTNLRNPFISFSKKNEFTPALNAFRMAPTKVQEVSSLLKEAVRHQALRKFALIYPANSSGEEYARVFRDELNAYNIKAIYDRSYMLHDNSQLLEIGEELEKLNVRAVFFPDDLRVLNRLLPSISEERRKTITFLGTPRWAKEGVLLRSRNILNRIMFVNPFYEGENGTIKNFISAFENRFQHKPHFLAAQSYDLMQVVFKASRISRKRELSMTQALKLVKPFKGLTGLIRVRASGEIEREFQVVRLGSSGLESVNAKSSKIYTMKGNDKTIVDKAKISKSSNSL